MKIKLFLLFIFMLVLALFPALVSADVIEPGMKEVKFYYEVSNIQNYPDYVFLIHGIPSPSYQIINSSEFSFYRLSKVSIYAIKKSDFNENELKGMNNSELENFFKNDPRVIRSNIELQGIYKTLSINNPLEKALVILEITSLNKKNMEIKRSKVIYIYTDGSSQEEIFTDQNTTPEPSRKSALLDKFWYMILPILAIIAIALILIARRFK